MKSLISGLLVLSFLVIVISCDKKDVNKNMTQLTERIQYPVFIRSPYGDDGDWYRENMEGPKREAFVKMIFDAAYSGKVKAYDYLTNEPLTVAQVKAIGNKSDTLHLIKEMPVYKEYDTIINQKLNLKDIHRITFLEEWYMDVDKFRMEKKVVGICPSLTIYEDSTDVKGYKPLFWLYLDEKYPIK
jgi:hypothetical protein